MTRHEIEAHRTAGTITDRQAEILHLWRRGFSQRQIALGLGISRATVRDHLDAALTNIRKDAAA